MTIRILLITVYYHATLHFLAFFENKLYKAGLQLGNLETTSLINYKQEKLISKCLFRELAPWHLHPVLRTKPW